jgi:hypothetical protein
VGSGRLYFKTDGMELRRTEIHQTLHGIPICCEHAKCTEPSQELFLVVLGLSAFNPPVQTIELHKDKVISLE